MRFPRSIKTLFYSSKFASSFFFLLTLLLSYRLLPIFGVLTYGDNVYLWPWRNYNFLSTWDHSYMGMPWAGLFGVPVTGLMTNVLVTIGFSNGVTSYILNYLPVALTAILLFFVVRRISGNQYVAYFSGIFILLNNFILEQIVIWPGHYFWNVIALILLIYFTWRIFNEGLNYFWGILIILSSILILHPFLWVLYISYFSFFILFTILTTNNFKRTLLFGLFTLTGVCLIHGYWLFHFIYNMTIQSAATSYKGNQINVLEGYRTIANYKDLFNLYNYPGFEARGFHNILQTLFNYLFLAFILFLFTMKKKSKILIFFLCLYVLYFVFSMGPNGFITGNIWLWIFEHVPGFGFFRSFTRFLQINILLLPLFLALLLKGSSHKYSNRFVLFLTILLLVANIRFFDGNFNGTATTANVPKEYSAIDTNYFRKIPPDTATILSLPAICYESNTWNINQNKIMFPQITYFKMYYFSQPAAYNSCANSLQVSNPLFGRVFKYNDEFTFYKGFDDDIDHMNIRFILIQKDLFDIFQTNKRVDAQKYENYFSRDNNYILRERNNYFSLYENKSFSPIVVGKNVTYNVLSDTTIKIHMSHLKSKEALSYLQSFHPQWMLYLEKANATSIFGSRFSQLNVVNPGELTFLYKKPVFANTHGVYYQYANSWLIDPKEIRNTFPSRYYKINNDGSIDIDLLLHYKPQSFLVLGVYTSLITLAGCIGGLMFLFKFKKRA